MSSADNNDKDNSENNSNDNNLSTTSNAEYKDQDKDNPRTTAMTVIFQLRLVTITIAIMKTTHKLLKSSKTTRTSVHQKLSAVRPHLNVFI